MNNFQTILIGIFLAIFVFAVLIFSGVINLDGGPNPDGLKGNVVVWGTLSSPDFYKVFETAPGDNKDLYINYSQKDPSTYQQSLIEAFANDTGPDLFLITPDMISKNKGFLYKIPYSAYPEKTFRDTFIDGAEIFLDAESKEIMAFPMVVDPIVMYFNKNMLANEGIAIPPSNWDELINLNSKITKRENDGTIKESLIALGRYDNVNNSKEILATLLLQNGNPIIKKEGGKYFSVLNSSSSGSSDSLLETILIFMVSFADPVNSSYSWNKTMPSSFDLFTRGKLALYIGKASELFKIDATNPNLSYDVTQIIQTKGTTGRTYGDIYAIAINKKSRNSSLAFSTATLLNSKDNVTKFSQSLSLPPALKSILNEQTVVDPFMYSFYRSALIAHSWPDHNPVATNSIFRELFDNILSNKLQIDAAINKAQGQLSQTIQ